MAESHYCEEHGCKFYQNEKDGRQWYSHKVKGTDRYCNEPEGNKTAKLDEMTKDDWADKDLLKSSSIEAQNAYTGGVQLMVAGIVKREETLGQTIINYAMSKLSNWASMGETQNKPPRGEPMATSAQRKQMGVLAKEKEYGDSLPVAIMSRLYGVSSSQLLTEKQATDFIKILNEGKYLNETPDTLDKIEPSPF